MLTLTALSNRELACVAERDPRYLVDPLLTALVNRLVEDDTPALRLAGESVYQAEREKDLISRLLAGNLKDNIDEDGMVADVLGYVQDAIEEAVPLVESLSYLECTHIPGGPVVRTINQSA